MVDPVSTIYGQVMANKWFLDILTNYGSYESILVPIDRAAQKLSNDTKMPFPTSLPWGVESQGLKRILGLKGPTRSVLNCLKSAYNFLLRVHYQLCA